MSDEAPVPPGGGFVMFKGATMAQCKPIIEPCNHGRFKLSCACGWKVHPRLLTVAAAETMWAQHASAS